jgi:hypothetical protein
METALIASIIAATTSIFSAMLAFSLSKKKDREMEWRKEKLAYYKALVESLSGIISQEATSNGQIAFSKAMNNLLLFAPQQVLHALHLFRAGISDNSQNRSIEEHDRLLKILLLAIRKDIGIEPKDDPLIFAPMLWSSGTQKER